MEIPEVASKGLSIREPPSELVIQIERPCCHMAEERFEDARE